MGGPIIPRLIATLVGLGTGLTYAVSTDKSRESKNAKSPVKLSEKAKQRQQASEFSSSPTSKQRQRAAEFSSSPTSKQRQRAAEFSSSPTSKQRDQARRSMKMNRGKTPPGDDMTPMPRRRPSLMDNYKGYPMPEKRPKK